MSIRVVAVTLLLILQATAFAETRVHFINDWRWEGPQAPLLLALDRGYYTEEGLEVSMDPGQGSLQAIPRVDSGEYDIGIADINSLIKYRDQHPDSRLQGVFVIYNSPPFALVGRPSLGVIGPSDLEGKTLGAPAADGAFAQWPVLVSSYGIRDQRVTIKDVSFRQREALLAEGEVDAITGFSFSSFLDLQAAGVPLTDISLMLMSDFGVDLYGNVIIVNGAFATSSPRAVSAFLRATTRGYRETIDHPAAAIEHVLNHNPDADVDVELRRLVMAIGHNIVTDEVREHGLGAIDMARLARSIEQLSESYAFNNRPAANEVFDERYLPELEHRRVPPEPILQ